MFYSDKIPTKIIDILKRQIFWKSTFYALYLKSYISHRGRPLRQSLRSTQEPFFANFVGIGGVSGPKAGHLMTCQDPKCPINDVIETNISEYRYRLYQAYRTKKWSGLPCLGEFRRPLALRHPNIWQFLDAGGPSADTWPHRITADPSPPDLTAPLSPSPSRLWIGSGHFN